jgi:hypothetical protein
MRISRLVAAALVASVLLLTAAAAQANLAPRWSDDQLTDFATVIVAGRVAAVASGADTTVDTIYTYVTVDVTDVLKGWLPESRIVIKQIGGAVGGASPRPDAPDRVAVAGEVGGRDRRRRRAVRAARRSGGAEHAARGASAARCLPGGNPQSGGRGLAPAG